MCVQTPSSISTSPTPSSSLLFNTVYPNISSKWKEAFGVELIRQLQVPDHWLLFDPPSCQAHYFIGILYVIILIPALFGNSSIFWLFYKCKTLRTPSNVLLLNLAISDFVMNIKMPVFIINSFYCRPITGNIGCQIYGWLGGLSGTCAILSISAISYERYSTISDPLKPRLTMKKAISEVVFMWLYSALFATPPVFKILNRYVPEGFLTSCSFDYLSKDFYSRMFVFAFFLAAYLLPLLVIMYSYIGIVVAVRKSRIYFNRQNEEANIKSYRTRADQRKKEIKLAKVALGLILLWFLSWTPYAVVALMAIFFDRSLTPATSMIPALFAKTSSVINPFIYALSHPKFRHEVKKRFHPRDSIGRETTIYRRSTCHKQFSCLTVSLQESVNASPEVSI